MTKLEEVARAMCMADGHNPDGLFAASVETHVVRLLPIAPGSISARSMTGPHWQFYVPKARAALEALRVPNEAMLRAALPVLRSDLKESEESVALTTEMTLSAMIDAILKEKPE